MSFLELILGPDLMPLAMVILIGIAMSGDNAIIIGLAAGEAAGKDSVKFLKRRVSPGFAEMFSDNRKFV